MLVVRFDMRDFNFLLVGHNGYFLLQDALSRTFLVSNECPHRGGPLHLGCMSDDGAAVICPWHGTRVTLVSLLNSAVPAVRVDHTIVAFLAAPESSTVTLIRRHVRLAARRPRGMRPNRDRQ